MKDRIRILDRQITEPKFGAVDFDAQFGKSFGVERWASIETVAGKTVFAGVGVDVAVTHRITLRFDKCVNSESWIIFDDDTRVDVIMVEDLDERHEWLRLLCVDRGDKAEEASKA